MCVCVGGGGGSQMNLSGSATEDANHANVLVLSHLGHMWRSGRGIMISE